MEHLRHTPHNKEIYARRKETIKRVFTDAKGKHGMRWTTLRERGKLSMQAMLTFADEPQDTGKLAMENTTPSLINQHQ
ncbi:hypothetical protein BTO28_08590 [Domibacillus epiphyticus]|uniref:Transposase DDE domain-containing protein n=1 Tax=Domibacillus epiphyticus TaxID=1714355 RepID=A0A1V2A7R4_9BACI|nr:hypothetical protein BTO28_08590 [Domibacillus epiphyticus]